MNESNFVREMNSWKIIGRGFSRGITGNSNDAIYARKFLKLYTIIATVILFTGLIFYGVADIGFNSSTFKSDVKGGFLEELERIEQEGDQGVSTGESVNQDVNAEAIGASEDLGNGENRSSNTIGTILKFFVDRKNSLIVYIGMLLLLLAFDYSVFRRIRYLFINYLDQYDINHLILERIRNNKEINLSDVEQLKNLKIKRNIVSYGILKVYHYIRYLIAEMMGDDYELDDVLLKDTSFKIHSVRICTNFINRLIHSWNIEKSKEYFADHFKDFKMLEEDRAFNFEEATNKNAVWIIRLGIFGTLLGITIAFFELYMAMGSLDLAGKGGITETFVNLVQQALLGNGIAIATSLTAHGSTLLLEIGVSFFLRNESNLFWLNNAYDAILNYPRFASKQERPEQVTEEIKTSIFDINRGMQTFQNNLEQASPQLKTVGDSMSSLGHHLQVIDQSVTGITEKMERFYASAGNYSDYFQRIGDNLKAITDATGGLVSRLDETEKSMSKVTHQTERFNNLLAALIESLIEISSGSAMTMAKSLKNLKKYEEEKK